MVNTDPNNGAELGAPFFQATVAAAMEYEVEVILTGRSGELAVRGVAEKLFVKPDSKQTVYDYIREAYEAGVKFKVCTPTLDLWGDDLKGAVVAIGNAPTALYRLMELLKDGAPRPAAILAFPVGFVGAAESKDALISADLGLPYLTLRGRRGGSAMAAAAVNALARAGL